MGARDRRRWGDTDPLTRGVLPKPEEDGLRVPRVPAPCQYALAPEARRPCGDRDALVLPPRPACVPCAVHPTANRGEPLAVRAGDALPPGPDRHGSPLVLAARGEPVDTRRWAGEGLWWGDADMPTERRVGV